MKMHSLPCDCSATDSTSVEIDHNSRSKVLTKWRNWYTIYLCRWRHPMA